MTRRLHHLIALFALCLVAGALASCTPDPAPPLKAASCLELEADVVEARSRFVGLTPGSPEATEAETDLERAQAAFADANCPS